MSLENRFAPKLPHQTAQTCRDHQYTSIRILSPPELLHASWAPGLSSLYVRCCQVFPSSAFNYPAILPPCAPSQSPTQFASPYGCVPLIFPESFKMSTESYYMGVDVGTGSARVCLIDELGNLRAIQSKKTETWNPRTNFYVGCVTTNTIYG